MADLHDHDADYESLQSWSPVSFEMKVDTPERSEGSEEGAAQRDMQESSWEGRP